MQSRAHIQFSEQEDHLSQR